MTQTPDSTFSPGLISQALRIPAGTLSTWARRGWMANFDAASAQGRGKAREFTLADALALSLIKIISTVGIKNAPPDKEGEYTGADTIVSCAPTAAKAYLEDPRRITGLWIRWYKNGNEISIGFSDTPPKPNPEATASFNLTSIFEKALREITAVAKDHERRTKIETIHPVSLPKISRTIKEVGEDE
jgi:hypothetical protein